MQNTTLQVVNLQENFMNHITRECPLVYIRTRIQTLVTFLITLQTTRHNIVMHPNSCKLGVTIKRGKY